MRKIIQGFLFAVLIIAVLAELVIMAIVWKNMGNEQNAESIKSKVINVVVVQEEKWHVLVNRLPVYSNSDVTSNAISNPIAELTRGDTVSLLEESTYYSKIQMSDGTVGYVWFDCIENITKQECLEKSEKIVVVDAGHQSIQDAEEEPIGPGEAETKPKVSSGTQGVSSGQPEHQLNLDIALKVEEILEAQGYTVVMIRKSSEVNISNMERAMIANQIQADAFVRIHADGSDNQDANGAMTIISTGENKYEVVNYYNESKKLATEILDAYTEATGINRNRIMESDDYSGINWCTVPVTIVEMGYMTNEEEDIKMQDSAMQIKMAEGISKGIINYLEHSYIE